MPRPAISGVISAVSMTRGSPGWRVIRGSMTESTDTGSVGDARDFFELVVVISEVIGEK